MKNLVVKNIFLYILNFIIWLIGHGSTFVLAILIYRAIDNEVNIYLIILVALIKVCFIYIGAFTDYNFKKKIQTTLYNNIKQNVSKKNISAQDFSESLNVDVEIISYFYMTLIDTVVNIIIILLMIYSLFIIEKSALVIVLLQTVIVTAIISLSHKKILSINKKIYDLENGISKMCINSTFKHNKYSYQKTELIKEFDSLHSMLKHSIIVKRIFLFFNRHSTLISLLVLYILDSYLQLNIDSKVYLLIVLYFTQFLEFNSYISNIFLAYNNYIASCHRMEAVFGKEIFDVDPVTELAYKELKYELNGHISVVSGRTGIGKSKFIYENFLNRKDVIVVNNSSKLFEGKIKENLFDIDFSILHNLKISELLEKQSSQISGGELVRVLIARALFLQPKVIVIDGVLSSLDTNTLNLILDVLEKTTCHVILVSNLDEVSKRNYSKLKID